MKKILPLFLGLAAAYNGDLIECGGGNDPCEDSNDCCAYPIDINMSGLDGTMKHTYDPGSKDEVTIILREPTS